MSLKRLLSGTSQSSPAAYVGTKVKEKICTASNLRRQQKWLIIYNALVDPRAAAEIAKYKGTNVRTVHQVIRDYNSKGAVVLETPGKGGRRKSYLSVAVEISTSLWV
jgi:hypothetical protein